MKLAFLGLGVMGYPMAGHLKAKGYNVTVYNRTTAKAEAWAKQHGGAFANTIADAVQGAEMVMMCAAPQMARWRAVYRASGYWCCSSPSLAAGRATLPFNRGR